MKKIVFKLIAIVLMFAPVVCYANEKIINANIKTKQIPSGTRIQLELIDPIGAPSSQEGEVFSAMLTSDQKVDNVVLLPKGSMVRGNIVKVVPNKRLSKTAVLYVNFDHIVTTTGKQLPLSVGLPSSMDLTIDGGIKNGGNYGYAFQQNAKNAKEMIIKSTKWGMDSTAKYVLVPVGAVLGTAGAGFYIVFDSIFDLFKKGNAVVFHQGSMIDVMLTKPIDIPVN